MEKVKRRDASQLLPTYRNVQSFRSCTSTTASFLAQADQVHFTCFTAQGQPLLVISLDRTRERAR